MVADFKHHGFEFVFDAEVDDLFYVASCVFGTRQLFAEGFKTESGVYALFKNTAERDIALNDENVLSAGFLCADSRGKTCRTAADDDNVINFISHNHSSFPGVPLSCFPGQHFGAGLVFAHFFGGDAEFASDYLNDTRTAETALAASHSGAQTTFYAVD